MYQTENLTHHYLIAMPSLHDIHFSRAVVYIAEHSEEGAMGFIINKPLHVALGTVLSHLNMQSKNQLIEETPVFMGGPVGQEHGFVIHDERSKEATSADIIVSASKEVLQEIANGQGPPNYLIALGYSAWEAFQLEQEIQQNDWLVVPFSPEILFEVPIEERWSAAALLLEIDIHQLSDQTGHA